MRELLVIHRDVTHGAYSQKVLVDQYAGVAQLVEQLICNQQVTGSTPAASSIFINNLAFLAF